MNNHKFPLRLFLIPLFLGMLLLSVQSASAKGPFARIVISGPRLADGITVTNASLLDFFSFTPFVAEVKAPATAGYSYVLTRYFESSPGAFSAFDRLHYFPNPTGPGGYIFYDGLTPFGGWSEYDGKWYRATPQADAAMRRLIAANTDKPVRARSLFRFWV